MKLLKKMPPPWWVRAGWILGALLLMGWSLQGFVNERDVGHERDRRARDLAVLVDIVPAPTGETARHLEEVLAGLEQSIGAIRKEFEVQATQAPVPENRSEAFFMLARYVADMRALAAAAGVICRDDEPFGFGTHARSGPANPLMVPVHRQRLAAEALLTVLFASGPSRFEGLQRERPEPGSVRDDSDFFEIDPELSVRAPGLVETVPLRVVFTGQTGVLRDFLNHLVGASPRFLVREVSVEPRSQSVPAGEPTSWVRADDSRFAVTVEWVELTAAGDGPDVK